MGFLEKYFVNPIVVEQGYNYINTITYAIIAFVLLYSLFVLFRKLKVNINFRFFLSALPYVIFASSLRAFVDVGYVSRNFWTVSPGIYLLATGFFLAVFVPASIIAKSRKYIITTLIGIGIVVYLWISNWLKLGFENLLTFLLIVLLILTGAIVFFLIFRRAGWKWILDSSGFSAFLAHLFDAIVTATILQTVGGWEKHPLPRFFIEHFGAISFLPLKLAVIIPAIYIISKEIEDSQLRSYMLTAIAILGFGEAFRNLISLVLV